MVGPGVYMQRRYFPFDAFFSIAMWPVQSFPLRPVTPVFLLILVLAAAAFPAPGDLDTSFDTDGRVISNFGSTYDQVFDSAIQPDGKILITGQINHNLGIARYNPDGSLDTSFDTDGYVTFPHPTPPFNFESRSVLAQSDGKIIAAGWGGDSSGGYIFIARYNSNGSLDTGFSGDGWVTQPGPFIAHQLYSVALLPGGRILTLSKSYGFFGGQDEVVLSRYNPDGTPDNTFDSDGVAFSFPGLAINPEEMAVQADGRIVMVGWTGSPQQAFIARYNSDGTLDTGFDGDGYRYIDLDSSGTSYNELDTVAIQPDNKIIAAGVIVYGIAGGTGPDDSAVVRFNTDGSFDTSFDTDGIALTSIKNACCDQRYIDIRLQPNGKLIAAAGYRLDTSSSPYVSTANFDIVRYNINGSLDSAWGAGGKISTDFGSVEDTAVTINLQSDGKLIVAGNVRTSDSDSHFALARYLGDLTTAAAVSISGRVVNSSQIGIGGALLTLTDDTGRAETVTTNPFGYYRFENVAAGRTYFLTVSHKQYSFSTPSRVLSVIDELTEIDFAAQYSGSVGRK